MVGDYERMLLFSEYANVLGDCDLEYTKDLVDPFTGCFSVPIPYTTTWLRFATKALGMCAAGATKDMVDFCCVGSPRVMKASKFVEKSGGESALQASYKKEKVLWDQFYGALEAAKGDAAITAAAKTIFDGATTH